MRPAGGDVHTRGVPLATGRRPVVGSGVLVELRAARSRGDRRRHSRAGPGFTAITGETGAGKTMLLTGLALLFGGRADAALVRAGHERAEIEGRFRIAPDGRGNRRWSRTAGGALDGDELVDRRAPSAPTAGPGHTSAAAACRLPRCPGSRTTWSRVHGQADQRGLLRPAVQRGGARRATPVRRPARRWRPTAPRFAELGDVRRELEDVTTHRRERTLEAEGLRRGLAEVDEVAPVHGEDVALAAECGRLGHVEALRAAAGAAHDAARRRGDDGRRRRRARGMLAAARRELDAVRGHDAELDGLATRVAEASYLLADVAADLAAYVDRRRCRPGPAGGGPGATRRLGGLTRRYAGDIDGVLAWATRRGRGSRRSTTTTRGSQELTAAATRCWPS